MLVTAPHGFSAVTSSGVADGSSEAISWRRRNGPGSVLSMPGGYKLCERKPTVRAEYARFVFEKNSAVRAFCTDTSQLKIVASGVRNVPRMVGATPGESG